MKPVFVDTSGFYAFLDATDSFHPQSARLFRAAEVGRWKLFTSSFVVHECWALIQARLGWDAVEDWLRGLVVRCEVVWVGEPLYSAAAARCRQARERRLSLTDCVSFEVMLARDCREAIADDEHFARQGIRLPAAP